MHFNSATWKYIVHCYGASKDNTQHVPKVDILISLDCDHEAKYCAWHVFNHEPVMHRMANLRLTLMANNADARGFSSAPKEHKQFIRPTSIYIGFTYGFLKWIVDQQRPKFPLTFIVGMAIEND